MISFIYRFLRWPCVTAIIIFIVLALGSSSVSGAGDIKKIKRLVARLQLDLSQVKEQFSKSVGKELALLEPLNAKLERLEERNIILTKKINSLKLDISLLDEKLQKYQSKSNSAQLSELYQLATVFALYSVGDTNSIEPLILELVNTGNNVQKDLLLLLLAETQKKQGFLEQGLGYYGALISDYPDSIYLNRAIFEASELLGKLGHSEEQMSMLLLLKEIDGIYGELARKNLE
jgi:DNA-binding transcriptional regulator GbsR (MarR family)